MHRWGRSTCSRHNGTIVQDNNPVLENQKHQKAARRIATTLFSGQAIGSAAMANISSIGAIIAAAQIGERWLGLPSALHTVGSAVMALIIGFLLNRIGRRNSLLFGLGVGIFGGVISVLGLLQGKPWLFILGLPFMGSAKASLNFGRFIVAEVFPKAQRGRAVATVVWGSTIGAVGGPFLIEPLARLSTSLGLYEHIGIYLLPVALYIIISIFFSIGLRPEPEALIKQVVVLDNEESRANAESTGIAAEDNNYIRTYREIFSSPPIVTAMSAMIIGHLVMVMIMVVTSVHMDHHGHSLTNIGAVLSSHTFGMFFFSVLTGVLLDRFGRAPVISAGACILVLAALIAPLSLHLVPLSFSLFLLGLGWNFCFVGGSTMLSDQLKPAERGKVQGVNDLLIGGIAATASLVSGFVFASFGYSVMAIVGAILAALLLMRVVIWFLRFR